jgi:4-amino-4-deoxy-L-arabinose transferase-like glycosyltransferase
MASGRWRSVATLPAAARIFVARRRGVLLALAIVLLGHWIVNQPRPFLVSFTITPELNERWRFDVPNLDAALLGLGVLVAGGVAFARATPRIDHPSARVLPDEGGRKALVFGRAPLLLGAAALISSAVVAKRADAMQYAPADVIVWLASLALAAASMWCADRAASRKLSIRIERWEVAALSSLMAFAFAIGTYKLAHIPNRMVGDEGIFWEHAKLIAQGKLRPSVFGLGGYSFPIASEYFQALFPPIFGYTMWAWRFSSFVPAWLAIIPTYFLARELFSRQVAITAATVMAVMPYFLAFSRIGYISSQSLFPVPLSLWLLYLGAERRSVFFTALSGIVAGIGFYTLPAARTAAVTGVLFLPLLGLLKQTTWRRAVLFSGIFVLGVALTAGPYLLTGSHQNPEAMSHKMLESCFCNNFYGRAMYSEAELYQFAPPIKVGDQTIFFNPIIWGKMIVKGIFRTGLAFSHDGLFSEHMMTASLPGPVAALFFTLGTAHGAQRIAERRFSLLFICVVVSFFALSALNTFPPRHTHILSLIPLIAILTALGASSLLIAVGAQRRSPPYIAGLAAIVVVIAVAGAHRFFVVAAERYQPEVDSVVFWEVMDLEAPENLIYVFAEAGERDWKPYLLSWFETRATFQTAAVTDVVAGRLPPINRLLGTRVVFRNALAADVLPALRRELGAAGREHTYRARDGRPNVTVFYVPPPAGAGDGR